MVEQNLLTEKKWLGTFNLPNNDFKFSGELIYSPTDGIKFNYLIIDKTTDFFHEYFEKSSIKIIYGILDNSKKCTLIGHFDKVGATKYGPKFTTISGKTRVWRLILGAHIKETTKFNKANFTLTNLDDFYANYDYKKTNFSDNISNSKLKITRIESGILESVHLKEVVHASNLDINNLIKLTVTGSAHEREKLIHFHSNQLSNLSLDYSEFQTLDQILNDINQVTKLLAFLLFSPTMPVKIKLSNSDTGEHSDLLVFQSINRDKRTLNLINEENKAIMEVNSHTIDFLNVALKWIEEDYDYEVLSSIVQNRTGWLNRNGIYGNFLLYASQLESIGKSLGCNRNNKYILPIKQFGSDLIVTKLEKFFKKHEVNNIGDGVASLRNDIAHTKRTEHDLLSKLHEQELINLSQVLFTIIISSILIDAGVDKKTTDVYQYHIGLHII